MLQAAFLAGYPARSFRLRTRRRRLRLYPPPRFPEPTTPQTLLVFDFGGGTLDISIVQSDVVRSREAGHAAAPSPHRPRHRWHRHRRRRLR